MENPHDLYVQANVIRWRWVISEDGTRR
jgi:hypothetical protein